jgi:thiamine biosynthesis lipoprotein
MVGRAAVVAALVASICAVASGCSGPGSAVRANAAAATSEVFVSELGGAASDWQRATADRRDKLVVFMTLWCGPCRAEQPQVERWAREHAAQFATLLVVSGSSAADARRMVRERQVDQDALAVWVDPDGAVAAHYGVESTPTLLWLGAGGELRGRWHHIDDVVVAPATQPVTPPGEAPEPPDPPAGEALEPVTDGGSELGTSYDVVVLAPAAHRDRAVADLASGRALVGALEARLSEWRPDSEVSRINRLAASGPVALEPDLRQLLAGALHVWTVTDGAFDITWRPLGDLWRDAMVADQPPAPAALAEVLAAVGSAHVTLDARGIAFDHPRTQIGVAGVAKGWIIDALWRHLVDRGWAHVIVNIGGDLRTSGRQADGRRQVFRLADPWQPGTFAGELEVEDTAIATSGNYARVRPVAGQPVGHILDPRTGRPPSFDGSVTVLTRDAAMADALATGLFVLGPDAGLALVRQSPGVEVVYVTRDGLRSSLDAVDGAPRGP